MLPAFYFRRCAACAVALVLLAQPVRVVAQAEKSSERAAAATLKEEYRTLATAYAARMPGWRPQEPASGSLLFVAPDEYSSTAEAPGQNPKLRQEYASELFELAQRAADAGQLSFAFQWATETLREDPDHADARRILGYEKHDGHWLTPYGVRMAEDGKAWNPKYGWIAPADVSRYDAGERLVGKRWLSSDEDAARHREMKNGWQVRTDHFLVTTNHSLEAAAELSARLEQLHQIWRQLFAGFYLTENEVRRLFAGERQPRKQARPFRVYYYRDQDQYVSALRRRQPRIAETLGIYFDEDREAHFFAASENGADTAGPPLATLFHEASHQLFKESKPTAKWIGELANYWVVEGVATYFETLREHEDPAMGLYFTVGEPDAGRLPAARERLVEGFYVPSAELTRLGKRDLQRHADLAKLYSQSAGLAAYLMDGENGRYRESFVRYLDAVYAGRDSARSLPETTGASDSELDAQYRRHAESLP